MKCFLAQDLTTVRVASVTDAQGLPNAVTQPVDNYLDLAGYREVFVWVDVREFLTGTSLVLQSAPTKEETLFSTIITVSPLALGTTIVGAIPELATPFSRWLRWRVTPPAGSPGDVTFRLWVVANRSGRRPINRTTTTPT